MKNDLAELKVDVHNFRVMFQPDYLNVTDKEKETALMGICEKIEALCDTM